jgi:hypothetical protein
MPWQFVFGSVIADEASRKVNDHTTILDSQIITIIIIIPPRRHRCGWVGDKVWICLDPLLGEDFVGSFMDCMVGGACARDTCWSQDVIPESRLPSKIPRSSTPPPFCHDDLLVSLGVH